MTGTTKGVWHRPEAEPGAYANGWELIWGKADGVPMQGTQGMDSGQGEQGLEARDP